ncbi:MAG: hypothetical protein ACK566_02185 [Bacteroidota bacterium]|jgi:hypothetical protein
MKKIIEDYKKPVPLKWRRIGDLALLAIPVLEAQFNIMPVSDSIESQWLKWGITTFLVLFKVYTNTKTDESK